MDSLFLPSPEQAEGLRASMAASLLSSLQRHLAADQTPNLTHRPAASVLPSTQYARPIDFAAYFDLLALSLDHRFLWHPVDPHAAQSGARLSLAHLCQVDGFDAPPRPRISNLSHDHHSAQAIESLIRWWDMEPKNSLALTQVTPDELATAQQDIMHALDRLQMAAPSLYQEFTSIVSDIVLAQPGENHRMAFGGISSFSSWGAICLNQKAHEHWAHYYKKLVHECAHLVLFALARNEPLLLNSAQETHTSPLRDDPRPLDGIYHAAFVSAREAMALDLYLSHLDKHPGAEVDALATQIINDQLQTSVLAFWDCCDQLSAHAQLTGLGERILNEAKQYMADTFDVLEPS
jgi:HEXXH motif-containing protein